MIQIFGDKEKVMNSGLSIPFWGAEGIAAGMFTDNHPEGERSKSPLRWFA